MSIPVIVPLRPDGGHRDLLWAFVKGKFEEYGYGPIIESDSEGEWSRGEAINRGVAQTDAEVFIVADADVVYQSWEQPRQAAELALETGSLAYAHRRHHMLPWPATNLVLKGAEPKPEWAEQAVDNTMSSCWAITRASWDVVGGFDERFVNWGCEDWQWFAACGTLLGIDRVQALSFHLHHPREGEADHPYFAANTALGNRYMALRNNPEGMKAILSEPGGPLAEPESNAGKWDSWYPTETPRPFGNTPSYEKGAEYLGDCELVEDWGAGAGWFSTFIEKGRYRGVDGSQTPFAAEIADLTEYRSEVPGIFMRHVLEHNFEWQKILDNALASFTERMCLVLFTPMSENGTHDTEFEDPPGVPNLSFALADLTDRMEAAGVKWTVEPLGNSIPYGLQDPILQGTETLFLLER